MIPYEVPIIWLHSHRPKISVVTVLVAVVVTDCDAVVEPLCVTVLDTELDCVDVTDVDCVDDAEFEWVLDCDDEIVDETLIVSVELGDVVSEVVTVLEGDCVGEEVSVLVSDCVTVDVPDVDPVDVAETELDDEIVLVRVDENDEVALDDCVLDTVLV